MRNRLVASVFTVLTFLALASSSVSQTADKASSSEAGAQVGTVTGSGFPRRIQFGVKLIF